MPRGIPEADELARTDNNQQSRIVIMDTNQGKGRFQVFKQQGQLVEQKKYSVDGGRFSKQRLMFKMMVD
jgi:hypothetical protein